MKLSVSQLRRIIKEEVSRMLRENPEDVFSKEEKIKGIEDAITSLESLNIPALEPQIKKLQAELEKLKSEAH